MLPNVVVEVPALWPLLQGHLGSQQQWLATAAAHAASLAQLAQGVLLFEGSRSERQPEGEAALAPGPGSSQQYQPSWQQYESVLQQMQGLHQAYLAAEGSIEAANRELAEVQQRRSEALSVMQAAQVRMGGWAGGSIWELVKEGEVEEDA